MKDQKKQHLLVLMIRFKAIKSRLYFINMETFLEKLLRYYNLSNDDYNELLKEPNLEKLGSPFKFLNIQETSDYIKKSIDENKKILIYGDYDCDGIMSTSIIFNTLKQYKNFKCGYYIPNRELDGYGLTKANIDRFHSLGYQLIICVDNGIGLVDEIDYLNSIGMECIVMDHHTPSKVLPNAKFILHPTVSKFSEINMSAGEVTYYFSRVFLGFNDEYLLTLAMISTLSDMMELKKQNRELVRLGLVALNKNKYENILLLLKDKTNITEGSLSMYAIPKINAIGRIALDNSLFNIVRFFTTDTKDEYLNRINWIESINLKRKELINEAYLNANIKNEGYSVVALLDIKEGLCGLLANKYLEEYKKPTVIFVKSKEDGILKGSIRSKYGFNVIKAFDSLNDLLMTSGGHSFAGGLSIKESSLEEFKKRFEELAKEYTFKEEKKNSISINLNEINLQNYEILMNFAPFGYANEKPLFEIDSFNTNMFTYSKDHKHIITNIGINSSLIYFNFPNDVVLNKNVKLFGKFELNTFMNKKTVQFIVNSFEKN